jgi:hypothetical protein
MYKYMDVENRYTLVSRTELYCSGKGIGHSSNPCCDVCFLFGVCCGVGGILMIAPIFFLLISATHSSKIETSR